jgi:hypothetical protein
LRIKFTPEKKTASVSAASENKERGLSHTHTQKHPPKVYLILFSFLSAIYSRARAEYTAAGQNKSQSGSIGGSRQTSGA